MDNIIERLAAFAQLAQTNEPNAFTGPVSGETVADAEATLTVRFPESYKAFLRMYGSSLWPDMIYGLAETKRIPTDVVKLTLAERVEVEPLIYKHLIPICADGWGNHYCLDTSKFEDGECPVVFWNHELENQEPGLVAFNFLDWLDNLAKEATDA